MRRAIALLLMFSLAFPLAPTLAAQEDGPADPLVELLDARELKNTKNPVVASFLAGEGAALLPEELRERALQQLRGALKGQTSFMGLMLAGMGGVMGSDAMKQQQQAANQLSPGKLMAGAALGISPVTGPAPSGDEMQRAMQQALTDPWVRGIEAAAALDQTGRQQRRGALLRPVSRLSASGLGACRVPRRDPGPGSRARREAPLAWMLAEAESITESSPGEAGAGAGFGPGRSPEPRVGARPARRRARGGSAAGNRPGPQRCARRPRLPDRRRRPRSRARRRRLPVAALVQPGEVERAVLSGKRGGLLYGLGPPAFSSRALLLRPRSRRPFFFLPIPVARRARRPSRCGGSPNGAETRTPSRPPCVRSPSGSPTRRRSASCARSWTTPTRRSSCAPHRRSTRPATQRLSPGRSTSSRSDARPIPGSRTSAPRWCATSSSSAARRREAALARALAEGPGNDWLVAWTQVALLELGDLSQLPDVEAALARDDWRLDPRGFRSIWRAISPFVQAAAGILLSPAASGR